MLGVHVCSAKSPGALAVQSNEIAIAQHAAACCRIFLDVARMRAWCSSPLQSGYWHKREEGEVYLGGD